jgi:hypothetical protein
MNYDDKSKMSVRIVFLETIEVAGWVVVLNLLVMIVLSLDM